MFQQGYLERWEADALHLDEEDISEEYFPLWGVADVEEYLRSSNKLRQEQAREVAAAEASPSDAPAPAECSVVQPPVGQVPSAGKRVAWGAWFWVRRAIVAVLVCVVGSLLVTMAMNPSLTIFDAADLLVGRIVGLIGRIND